MSALALSDVHVLAAEPLVYDLRLAEALGFDRARNIRKLIARNSEELSLHGEICSTVEQNNDPRGKGARLAPFT